jgi:hypothetical protein
LVTFLFEKRKVTAVNKTENKNSTRKDFVSGRLIPLGAQVIAPTGKTKTFDVKERSK